MGRKDIVVAIVVPREVDPLKGPLEIAPVDLVRDLLDIPILPVVPQEEEKGKVRGKVPLRDFRDPHIERLVVDTLDSLHEVHTGQVLEVAAPLHRDRDFVEVQARGLILPHVREPPRDLPNFRDQPG